MSSTDKTYKILVISDYRQINSSRPEAEIFVSLAKKGHTIHILSYPEADFYNERFRTVGIKIFENHPTKKASRSYIKYLHALIQDEQYDFVHAFNSHGLTNAVWAMIGLPSKLIAYRGYAGQTHWYDPMMYTKYFHPRVDHIICLSEDIRTILSRNMPTGKHKLTTIHKGHNPDWYTEVIPIHRNDIGFTSDDVLLICVANVRPFKGIPYLIEAMRLLTDLSNIHLLLIGDGYDQEPVKSQIANSLFAKNIHVFGYRKDSLSIVAASDAFILTSTHGEALTKSVIEAMCLGIVPIITDIPGNKGLVMNGESGWVIPIKNPTAISIATKEMALDKNERKRRGQAAKTRIATNFNTSNTVLDYIKMYEKLKV